MLVSAADLQQFYASPLGRKLARDCAKGLAGLKPPAKSDAVIGFGYTAPFLDKFAAASRARRAFMPAAMAEAGGLPSGHNAELVDMERKFPLDDAAEDCVLAIHALEFCPDAQAMLRELWRILTPRGRLILLVPNRRGLWAHSEKTPFGHGQPYSRRQLAEMLGKNGFDFGEIAEYAHFLPHKANRLTPVSKIYEKLAKRFFPYFGGVLLVEAQKRLYNPLLQEAGLKRRPAFLPAGFVPQPANLKPQSRSSASQAAASCSARFSSRAVINWKLAKI